MVEALDNFAEGVADLEILHFNDVYNINKHAARFVTAMKEHGC